MNAATAPARFLRLGDVLERTGLSKTTIYARISRGEFPRQVPLGAQSSGWLESEIEAWIVGRVAARDGVAASASPSATPISE